MNIENDNSFLTFTNTRPTEFHHNSSAVDSTSDSNMPQDLTDLSKQDTQETSEFNLEDVKKMSEILENIYQQAQLNLGLHENQDETIEDIFFNYVQNLQSTALDTSINWTGLTYEFKAFQTITPEELPDGLEYLPARYVAVLDKLERNYADEELLTQCSQLEQIYQAGKNGMIENYTKLLQDNLGISNDDAQQIKDSFSTILDENASAYRDAVKQIQETIAQNGVDSILLKNHETYIARELRTQTASVIKQVQSNAAYSVQDLIIAGQIAGRYQAEISNAANSNKNVMKFALALSMIDMQTEMMIEQGEISKNMAVLLQNSRVSGHEAALYALNQEFAKQSEGSFAPIDRAAFQEIYDTVMNAYLKSVGDDTKII